MDIIAALDEAQCKRLLAAAKAILAGASYEDVARIAGVVDRDPNRQMTEWRPGLPKPPADRR
jgi:hypothetical protein